MKASVALFAALTLASSLASADQEADRMFVEGRDALAKRQFQLACDKFHAVHAIDSKAPSVLLNLGLCYEGLDKLATALLWLRKAQAMASEASPRQTEFEDEAANKKAELVTRVATLRIDASLLDSDAQLFIDGVRYARELLASPVELDAGSHQIEVKASAKIPYTNTIEIIDGQRLGPLKIPPLKSITEPPPSSPARGHRTLGWTLIGGGGALVIGAPLVAYQIQQRNVRAGRDTYRGGDKIAMRALGGAWIGGLVAAGIGAYFVITNPRPTERVSIGPSIGDNAIGVAAIGRW